MFVVHNPSNSFSQSNWDKKWKRRQRRKSCSGYSWRRQFFHNVNQARRQESMLKNDDEFCYEEIDAMLEEDFFGVS